jgi:hypothetical protein
MSARNYRLRSEFVTRLEHFLSGSMTLVELQEWVLANLQAILDSGDSTIIEAANKIDADLIGINEGLIDESSFMETLHGLRDKLQTIDVKFSELQPATTTISELISEASDICSLGFKARSGQEDFHFRRVLA